jgi:hypothetical protein
VAPTRRTRELLFVVIFVGIASTGCGWLPPDSPPAKPTPPDPDAAVLHDWTVTGHLLGPRALLSETDAAAFDGRTIAVTTTTYSSPWSGSCDEAGRQKQARALTDLTTELGVARDRVASLGLGDPLVEYRLSCGPGGTGRAPPLTLYVAGAHALTCWSGVCYALAHGQGGSPGRQ